MTINTETVENPFLAFGQSITGLDAATIAALDKQRAAEAKLIDPKTAEICSAFVPFLDVYCDFRPPEEGAEDDIFDTEWFARRPGSGTWVWFENLPAATRDALNARLENTGPNYELRG